MSFGVFCVEDDAFTTNVFGQIVTYPNLTEAGRAAVVWKRPLYVQCIADARKRK